MHSYGLNMFSRKTTWAGIGLVITGVFQCFSKDIVTGAQTICSGLAVIFVRDALGKL